MVGVAEIKETSRRLIHNRAAVSCDLRDDDHPNGLIFDPSSYDGPGLRVRYHNRRGRLGDLDGTFADVIDGIDRLVFNDENVADVNVGLYESGQPALTLSRGAKVTIPQYKGLMFILDSQEPPDGPLETIWVVARTRV